MPSRHSILVLGRTGMLGSTVFHRLRSLRADWRVDGTVRGAVERLSLEAEAGRPGLADLFRLARYDYVINCIGVLKNAIDDRSSQSIEGAIRVNALFPHEVADVAEEHGAKVIHVSTDAVFSGRLQQPYTEESAPDPIDTYGVTKVLGESPGPNVLNVRCSIVGRDQRQRGLLEWYLAASGPSVVGFVDYVWTPITTVQFADWCQGLVDGSFDAVRAGGHVLHLAPNRALSKADFLQTVRDHVGAGPRIERRSSPDGPCSRVLVSRAPASSGRPGGAPPWSTLFPELMAEFSSRGM
jgi:dTDP-4-dehydrorhamnose reductase